MTPVHLGSYILATAVSNMPGSDPAEWTLSGRTKDNDELVLDVAMVVPPPSNNVEPIHYPERFVMGMSKGRMERNMASNLGRAYPNGVAPYSDTPEPSFVGHQLYQKRALDQCIDIYQADSSVRGFFFFL